MLKQGGPSSCLAMVAHQQRIEEIQLSTAFVRVFMDEIT